jgi:hypothetical protein
LTAAPADTGDGGGASVAEDGGANVDEAAANAAEDGGANVREARHNRVTRWQSSSH